MNDITIHILLNEFIYSKRVSGLSDKSINDYQMFIKLFIDYVGTISLSNITLDIVHDYINTLLQQPISRATVSTYVRNLKIFLVWISKEYALPFNPKEIKVPKAPKKNPHIYNDDEISLIFKMVYADGTWINLRNCSIVALMLDSGLRRNEVVLLKYKNIDFKNMTINVFGKGAKERIVPLGRFTLNFLKMYMKSCPFESEFVFVDKVGKPINFNCIKLFMAKLSKRMPFEFSSHKLRHNFATNFLIDCYDKKGVMDVYALMTIMGHEDVETTKRYLHIANQVVYSRNHISHLDLLFSNLE